MEKTKDIRTKGNYTRAATGSQAINDLIDHRKVWWQGKLRDTGFMADTRTTPAPGTVAAPTTVTAHNSNENDTLTQVCDIIGGKPDRISWKDYGRIVAAAYATGGRDAAYLDRIEQRAKMESDFNGLTLDDLFWIMAAAEEKGVWSELVKAGQEMKEGFNKQALKDKEGC